MNRMIWISSAAVALTLSTPLYAQATQATQAAQTGQGARADRAMRADSNGDGVLTREEARAGAEAAFTRMDADRDGRLSQADRTAIRAQASERIFAATDANGDGAISRAEWDAARERRQSQRMARAGDAHGGGQHARGERHGGRGDHAMRGGGRQGARMLRQADSNGDQAIDRQEFMAAAMQRFERVDADKDGRITAEERAAARSAMRARLMRLRNAITSPSN